MGHEIPDTAGPSEDLRVDEPAAHVAVPVAVVDAEDALITERVFYGGANRSVHDERRLLITVDPNPVGEALGTVAGHWAR